jgi:hypothetical protein
MPDNKDITRERSIGVWTPHRELSRSKVLIRTDYQYPSTHYPIYFITFKNKTNEKKNSKVVMKEEGKQVLL